MCAAFCQMKQTLTKLSRTASRMAPFASIKKPPVDPMNILKRRADGDTHPDKVDLGIGIYRNEHGGYYEFPAIKKVSCLIANLGLLHSVP